MNLAGRLHACTTSGKRAPLPRSLCSKARTRRSRSFLRGVLVQFYLGRWLANVVHFYPDHHRYGLAAVGVCAAAPPSVGLCVLVTLVHLAVAQFIPFVVAAGRWMCIL